MQSARRSTIIRRRPPTARPHRRLPLPAPPNAGGGARLSRPQPRQSPRVATSSDRQREDNPLTVGLVSLLTESLRLLGVGKDRFEEAEAASEQPRPKRGDVDAVRRRIAADFSRAYFVVGQLDDGIYDPQCRFADPTVAFRGVRLWRRNLALLTPFLIEPRIDLLPPQPEDEQAAAAAVAGAASGLRPKNPLAPLLGGLFGGGGSSNTANASSSSRNNNIVRLGPVGPNGEEVLRARWFLETRLSLPWRPLISVKGATDYTLDLEESNRVVDHVESWDISGTEALLQLFRPGPKGAAEGG